MNELTGEPDQHDKWGWYYRNLGYADKDILMIMMESMFQRAKSRRSLDRVEYASLDKWRVELDGSTGDLT